jgi:hypothetical protein
MEYKIKVTPNARKPRVVQEEGLLKVYVNAPAVDNKANDAVIKVIATHFKIRKSAVGIIAGFRSRQKMVRIEKS